MTLYTSSSTENFNVIQKQLDSFLISRDWIRNSTDDENKYFYNNKKYSIYDEVRVCLTNNNIKVSVPVADFPYLYVSKFNYDDYDKVVAFVERHLDTYEERLTTNN